MLCSDLLLNPARPVRRTTHQARQQAGETDGRIIAGAAALPAARAEDERSAMSLPLEKPKESRRLS